MRASAAVLNPSLFEGWSTTVEAAKAVGVPLLLSDLRVHREQAPENALFFDPGNVDEMAKVLGQAWGAWAAGPRPVQEAAAGLRYEQQRAQFGRRFVDLVQAMTIRLTFWKQAAWLHPVRTRCWCTDSASTSA